MTLRMRMEPQLTIWFSIFAKFETAWPSLSNNDDNDKEILRNQLNLVSNVYEQFLTMKIFKNIRKGDVLDGYTDIVRYCQRYFDFEKTDQFELLTQMFDVMRGQERIL